jgi:WD40 repeat protein
MKKHIGRDSVIWIFLLLAVSLHGESSTKILSQKGWISAVAYSVDGSLASGGEDGILQIWSSCLKPKRTFKPHDSAITALVYSPDGKQLAAGYWDGTLCIVYMDESKTAYSERRHSENITSIAFSKDGKFFELQTIIELGNEYDVLCLSWSPDGKRIATGDGENELRVWDTENGEELLFIDGHEETVTSVAYSPNGKILYSGSWDNSVVCWDTETGEPVHAFEFKEEGKIDPDVLHISLTSDGRLLAVNLEPNVVQIIDLTKHRFLKKFTHAETITQIAFSQDNRHLAASSNGKVFIHQINH